MKFFRRLRERNTARTAYLAAEKQLGEYNDRLALESGAWERGKLLRKMADLEMDQCRRHDKAFGRDVLDDGISMADSLRYTSMLYRCLADVEHVVACNGRVGRNWRFSEFYGDADEVFDRMVAEPSLAGRTALLEELADAVRDKVGAQAVETLWCLPSPGHSGWMTVEAKRRWREAAR